MTVNRRLGKILKKYMPEGVKKLLRFWYWKKIVKNQNRPRKTLQFEVRLTDHCNLNCAGCCHFSPIAHEKFLDLEIFERDCKRLYELTHGWIEKVHLMGGEPLLHPKCNEIIETAVRYFGKGVVEIITNGILLPNQKEEFYETCRRNKVTLIVTKYPIRRNDERIKELTGKYDINLEYWGEKIYFVRIPLDLSGRQNKEKNFRECKTRNLCIQPRNGKLYTCHTAAYYRYI
jgi:uncharacterized radical SAM superfamily Fe-S cluster-containing enzyme